MFITTGMLSQDVKKPQTSLGAYLRSAFPDLRALQAQYKAAAGPMLVEGTRSTASLVGTSLDLIVRLIVKPDVVPESAILMYPFNFEFHAVVGELAELVAQSEDDETQARAVYAMAECVAAYRAGPVWAYEMYAQVKAGVFTVDASLQDAPPDAVSELIALRQIIVSALLPRLRDPLHLAPTFDLTHLGPDQRLAAEADLITNGFLLDVKSNMGVKNKRGERPDALKPEHIYQLLGYALLDYSNAFDITSIGIFSARYGQIHEWSLAEVLDAASDTSFDLTAARQLIWDLLQQERDFVER